MSTSRTLARLGSVALCAVVVLAGCGGGIKNAKTGSKGKCGTVNMAVNPWVGYEADAYVIGDLAEKRLGCTVNYKKLVEQVSWKGFSTGAVDVVMENWGHPELVKKYITQEHVAVDAGPTGNKGIIGWYIPPWMVQKYPGITNWKNLNKYASLFKTSESGGKGQLLDGDPSYVTNDEALVKNLHLNYKVVVGGSEAALIQSFRTAQQQKKPLLAYFYQPQWFFNEVHLVKINLPKYTKGCDAVPAKIACDYPPYNLNKVVSKKFATSGSPAYSLIKKFHWTNADQNSVSKDIAQGGMDPAAAAQKWIDANPSKVKAWLK